MLNLKIVKLLILFLGIMAIVPMAANAQNNAVNSTPVSAPVQTKSAQIWQDLHDLKTIDFGPADAPELFVVVDPLCPFCAAYWDQIDQALNAGARMHVRLVLIGTISCESLTIAEQIYAADDLPSTWRKVHAKDPNPGLRLPTPEAAETVRKNQLFFLKWKQETVPLTIYKTAPGEVRIIRAKPDTLDSLFHDLDIHPDSKPDMKIP